MTFIASVIAKEGVAIIADSLVTTSQPVLDFGTFQKYLSDQKKNNGKGVSIEAKDIAKLFKVKPSYTKDYEDKLYKYDKFTAITTAGSASINNKRIKKLIQEAIKKFKPTGRNTVKNIGDKISQLIDFITQEVKKFLNANLRISETIFIVTFYAPNTNKTTIYKLTVKQSRQEDLEDEEFEFVDVDEMPENIKVVCDGQNRMAERILFGDFNAAFDLIPKIVQRVAKDFKLPANKVGQDYWSSILEDESIINEQMWSEAKINKLTGLSLQQAVDLANLLMKMEIDIQKYTENIPTVGGVIKLAVIDDEGFKFVSGNTIVKHHDNI
ncbi:hypothetical protein ACFOWA_20080 [Pedobacter lithocola]|uniref:Uncharacterized protein n=1 Tax=Pedobacter lithocola TaxID=1908239 RepID=A0ABV8PEB7_9SPHI